MKIETPSGCRNRAVNFRGGKKELLVTSSAMMRFTTRFSMRAGLCRLAGPEIPSISVLRAVNVKVGFIVGFLVCMCAWEVWVDVV